MGDASQKGAGAGSANIGCPSVCSTPPGDQSRTPHDLHLNPPEHPAEHTVGHGRCRSAAVRPRPCRDGAGAARSTKARGRPPDRWPAHTQRGRASPWSPRRRPARPRVRGTPGSHRRGAVVTRYGRRASRCPRPGAVPVHCRAGEHGRFRYSRRPSVRGLPRSAASVRRCTVRAPRTGGRTAPRSTPNAVVVSLRRPSTPGSRGLPAAERAPAPGRVPLRLAA